MLSLFATMIATLGLLCTLSMVQPQTGGAQDVAKMPKGMIEGSKLKEQFNKDKDKVRLMFIFSPS